MKKYSQEEIKNLDAKFQKFFNDLVGWEGPSETLEGEIVRAVSRIVYRYYNDGDVYYEGYGCTTVGPCHAFLTSDKCPLKEELKEVFDKAEYNDSLYESMLYTIVEIVLSYLEKNSTLTLNEEGLDMWNFESHYIDENEMDYDTDEYYDNWIERGFYLP